MSEQKFKTFLVQSNSINTKQNIDKAITSLEGAGCEILSVCPCGSDLYLILYKRKPRRSNGHATKYDRGLEEIYQLYPRKRGKAEGIARLKKIIKSQSDLEIFGASVRNFANEMKREGRPADKIPYFSTFVSKYWEEFKPGSFTPNKRYEFL